MLIILKAFLGIMHFETNGLKYTKLFLWENSHAVECLDFFKIN